LLVEMAQAFELCW